MKLWPFRTHEPQKHRIDVLEEEVRAARGRLAINIVDFERADNRLDELVRQHLQLLRGGEPGETHP